MAGRDVHTVPNPEGSGWVNEVDGKIVSRHANKDLAVSRGREIAIISTVEHFIHDEDGTIARKDSYGDDRHPKG
jgi:hypothetical protein